MRPFFKGLQKTTEQRRIMRDVCGMSFEKQQLKHFEKCPAVTKSSNLGSIVSTNVGSDASECMFIAQFNR